MRTGGGGQKPKTIVDVICTCPPGNCTCRLFDTKSYNFGEMTFLTGGEDMAPHWDVREDSLMFWIEDSVEHCRDGCVANN